MRNFIIPREHLVEISGAKYTVHTLAVPAGYTLELTGRGYVLTPPPDEPIIRDGGPTL